MLSRGVRAKIAITQITTGTENEISIDGSLSEDLDHPQDRDHLNRKPLKVIFEFPDIYLI